MKYRVKFTDAPPDVEEAFARSKRIPNFIDINNLVRRDGTRPNFAVQKTRTYKSLFSFPTILKKVAAL